MNQAMQKAKETFAQGNYTCVWCRGDELLTSKEAGLRLLLTRIREGKELSGFYAADKISASVKMPCVRLCCVSP